MDNNPSSEKKKKKNTQSHELEFFYCGLFSYSEIVKLDQLFACSLDLVCLIIVD